MLSASNPYFKFLSDHYGGERAEALWLSLQAKHGSASVRSVDLGGSESYQLDTASYVVAQSVPDVSHKIVLDLCAAPGGKSLVIAHRYPRVNRIICNEISKDRRFRMKANFDRCLPPEMNERMEIWGRDGASLGFENLKKHLGFDGVLVDAPCSSDAHHVEQKGSGADFFSEKKTKALAQRQYALLCSAILATRPGGWIQYATCTLSPLENDAVIQRVCEKKSDLITWEQIPLRDASVESLPAGSMSHGERTSYGVRIFPDQYPGQGPLYTARLRRRDAGA